MKHSDLMILHKIKYKHIGMIMLVLFSLSLIWTHPYLVFKRDTVGLWICSAIGVLSFMVLVINILDHFSKNWNKTVL
jgi:hypothetical protein